jgi:hypothetical protein
MSPTLLQRSHVVADVADLSDPARAARVGQSRSFVVCLGPSVPSPWLRAMLSLPRERAHHITAGKCSVIGVRRRGRTRNNAPRHVGHDQRGQEYRARDHLIPAFGCGVDEPAVPDPFDAGAVRVIKRPRRVRRQLLARLGATVTSGVCLVATVVAATVCLAEEFIALEKE